MAASTALQVLVSPFLGVVFENLGSLIGKEIGLVLGVNKQLEKLSNTLSTIRDVLEDAEARQITDKPIYNWLRKLKDLAYEADDILDECATEALILESEIKSSNIQVISGSVSSCLDFKQIMFRRSIGKRIQKLIEKFSEVADLRNKFQLNLIPRDVQSGMKQQRETSYSLAEPQVYGRDGEKEHIVKLLLNGGEGVSVYCIVGMGGLGKTTLAQMVYNDQSIQNHFEISRWVCVSDDFVLKTLLKSIIGSTGGNARDLEDLEPLQRRVEGILSGKKFLMVLDDVWNEDQTKWYQLKSLLTCGCNGSSIIVTTRLQSVASITSTLPICRLEILSEDNSWSLFKHYAFGGENEESNPKLTTIGKEIVKKGGGVPLAAKALGGLLRFKREEKEWLSVRDSALWDLPQDNAILPALKLSYNQLPSQLRQCFAYCSIYPKDYNMGKEELIHLWMANGFVQPKGNMELEDIGNEIFNELLWRSFFQDPQKDEYNEIRSCKMHDLVHDLACSITMNECTVVEVDKEENDFKGITRHLSLHFGYSSSSTNKLNFVSRNSQPLLRTFLRLSMSSIQTIQGLDLSKFKCVRVLDLGGAQVKKLPVSIGNLKHLRYLDLSYCQDLTSLPDESICNLRNLQVLKLNGCHNLQFLPKSMRKMSNLRHLGIEGCYGLTRMPVKMGKLICLQVLSMFIVTPKSGCGISELQRLDHLRGEFLIKGLEHVNNSRDAKNANLIRKQNLVDLSLVWSEYSEQSNCSSIEEEEAVAVVGEGLQPHQNLKRLVIHNYMGKKIPSWMSSSCLPNLVTVSLMGCRRCEHLPPLGQLPFLENLTVSGMDSVKCIGDEFYSDDDDHHQGFIFFSKLKSLDIGEMPNLEEWSAPSKEENRTTGGGGGGGELVLFPSLESLRLGGFPKLRTLPPLPSSLQRLELNGCNEKLLETSLESLPQNSCLSSLEIVRFGDEVMCENKWSMMVGKLASLQSLNISSCCKELVCLPEEMKNLTSLKFFDLCSCHGIKCLPELGSITDNNNNTSNGVMLRMLRIQRCGSLTSVSEVLRHQTNLEDLLIIGCPKLEFSQDDFQHLTSLRSLHLWGLPNKMTSLPEGLQHVAGTLEVLIISSCSELTSLEAEAGWIEKFTSLRRLGIWGCKNLKQLPEGLKQLTALQTLDIIDCNPELHKRLVEKERGDEWHKIQHIPHLQISISSSSSSNAGLKRMIMPCFSNSSLC